MKIKQLSLFIENKPGSLNAVCQILKNNNINIRTLSLADTEQFGILRLLEEAGLIVRVTEVLALPVDDRVGGLAAVLDVLDRNNLSVEYMYAFTFGKEGRAVMVFRFEDPDKALEALTKEKIDIIESIGLFH